MKLRVHVSKMTFMSGPCYMPWYLSYSVINPSSTHKKWCWNVLNKKPRKSHMDKHFISWFIFKAISENLKRYFGELQVDNSKILGNIFYHLLTNTTIAFYIKSYLSTYLSLVQIFLKRCLSEVSKCTQERNNNLSF